MGAVLRATDPAPADLFGISVALDGSQVLLGALGDDDACPGNPLSCQSGAAYVFRRYDPGTPLDRADDFWAEEAKLTASDGSRRDWFGESVGIAGDWAIVGAGFSDEACPWRIDCDSGAAYVFLRHHFTWWEWAKLTASDAAFRDQFGRRVAISNDWAAVAASGGDDAGVSSGAVYLFRREDAGTPADLTDDSWVQSAKLNASDGAAHDVFGSCISLSMDRMVIGASGVDDAASNSGSVYVFRRDTNATPQDIRDDTWVEEAELHASDAEVADGFGRSCAIDGDRIVVGAPGVGNTRWLSPTDGSGAVYLFRLCGDGTAATEEEAAWVEVAKLRATEPIQGTLLGSSVGFSGSWVVAGAPGGFQSEHPGFAYAFFVEDRDVDGDALLDECDPCPESLVASTLVLGRCDTAVANQIIEPGCTMADTLSACVLSGGKRGWDVRCVNEIARRWKMQRLISGVEFGRILSCAGGSERLSTEPRPRGAVLEPRRNTKR